MTTRVIIVRHGQSTYNAEKRIQGRCDESVLTEKGRIDAEIVGTALSKLSFDAFYASPLQRAKQTALVIHGCLKNPPPLQVTDLLMEIDLPAWEGLSKQEVKQKFSEDYRIWKESPEKFKMQRSTEEGMGEFFPVLSLYQQAEQFWREVLSRHRDKTILVVAHNGIDRCSIMSAVGIECALYHSIQQSNCCISVLNFSGGLGEPVQIESLNQTGHLGIPLPPPRNPHSGPRLLLIRHGETDWNLASRFQGTRDIPLNDTGRSQARKAAEFLKDVTIDFAITSPMLRPKETAQIILQYHDGVELQSIPELSEIAHGLWEGKLETEIEAEFPGLLAQWKQAPETVQMPKGENLQQVWDRSIAAWNQIVKIHADSPEPKTGILVAHDAINKVILCYLLGLKPANFWNIKQGNGAVSVIDYPLGAGGPPVIQALNITTHLGAGVFDKTAAGAL